MSQTDYSPITRAGDRRRCSYHGTTDFDSIDLTITYDGVEWELGEDFTLDICPECLTNPKPGGQQVQDAFEQVAVPGEASADDDSDRRPSPPEELPGWEPVERDETSGARVDAYGDGCRVAIHPITGHRPVSSYTERCPIHGLMETVWLGTEYEGERWRVADGYVLHACEECLDPRHGTTIEAEILDLATQQNGLDRERHFQRGEA